MIPNAGSEAATPLLKAAAYLSALLKLHALPGDVKHSPEQGGLSGLATTHGIQVFSSTFLSHDTCASVA